MAAKTSVNSSLQSFHDKPYPSLGLCVPQAILEENPVLHIRDRDNQRHVLLQRYACKRARLEREASRLHNSCYSCSILPKYIRNYLRRSEIQNFPGGMPQTFFAGALRAHLCAPRIAGLLEPFNEFLPTPMM